jgi:hypothetical protein
MESNEIQYNDCDNLLLFNGTISTVEVMKCRMTHGAVIESIITLFKDVVSKDELTVE